MRHTGLIPLLWRIISINNNICAAHFPEKRLMKAQEVSAKQNLVHREESGDH